MKNNPILRHIVFGLFIFLPMYLIGLVIYPFVYIFRKQIRANKITFLWWFLNDTENGDYGIYNKNFFGAYKWSAIKNSHWNLKLQIAPNKGKMSWTKVFKNTTNQGGLMFCNYTIFGKQYAKYQISDEIYFRYSFTKYLFGERIIWNVQLGTDSKRYIYKNRFKINQEITNQEIINEQKQLLC